MLSCDKINRAISKQRLERSIAGHVFKAGSEGEYAAFDPLCPDYCHDWAVAGPLLVRLWEHMGTTAVGLVLQGWQPKVGSWPEAISRAYHAAFCEEE